MAYKDQNGRTIYEDGDFDNPLFWGFAALVLYFIAYLVTGWSIHDGSEAPGVFLMGAMVWVVKWALSKLWSKS